MGTSSKELPFWASRLKLSLGSVCSISSALESTLDSFVSDRSLGIFRLDSFTSRLKLVFVAGPPFGKFIISKGLFVFVRFGTFAWDVSFVHFSSFRACAWE